MGKICYSVDHITVNVKDMESSKLFYGRGLGLELGEYVDMGDHQIQYFHLSGATLLELITYDCPGEMNAGSVDSPSRYRHMALNVLDIESFSAHIEGFLAEYPIATISMALSECPELSFRNMLIVDPNGVEIEILER